MLQLSKELLHLLPEPYGLILEFANYIPLEKALDFNVLLLGWPQKAPDGFVVLRYSGSFIKDYDGFACRVPVELHRKATELDAIRSYPSEFARRKDPHAAMRLFNKEDGVRIAVTDVFYFIGKALAISAGSNGQRP